MEFPRKRALPWALLLFMIFTLFFYPWYREGTLNPCKILNQELISALLEPYSGTVREANLLEPVALAIGHKRVNHFVEQKSRIECALTLYQLWRDPKVIEEELGSQ